MPEIIAEDAPASDTVVVTPVVVMPDAGSGGESTETSEADNAMAMEVGRLSARNEELERELSELRFAQISAPEVRDIANAEVSSVIAELASVPEEAAEIGEGIIEGITAEAAEASAEATATVEGESAEIASEAGEVASSLVEGETLQTGPPIKDHWSKGAWPFGKSSGDPFARG